ncbi:MAG TPA: glycosyltransferase [Nocardioidaceae bacterium]|nr:glycosyltransferase [Nocardioidaceae bacterium]
MVLPVDAPVGVLPLYVEGARSPELVLDRRRHRVPAGQRVSFATYVNAFPASYWQHWTSVRQVCLAVELDGPATVEVFRTDAAGRARRFRRMALAAAGRLEVILPVAGFSAGGWYWFEVVAAGSDVLLTSAAWTDPGASAAPREQPTASIGVTTFDRVDSCAQLLARIAEDDDLVALLDHVYVVDQGTRRVVESAAFSAPAARLGDRLRVIEQPNLGGSGGFARAQLETLRAGRSDAVLLLDDDIAVDTELLRRAIVFAGRCTRPTIVGGQMLALSRPTELHAMGERVERRRFHWGPVDPAHRDHDLAAVNLRDAPWLHRREDVDYNGWWTCLIPVSVLAAVGLSMPLFLKWDDAEYGLRAGAAGHPTVTLPGVGVWHVPWWDKDDTIDWQAYFHQRNRVITALLHSPYSHGGALVPELMAHQVKHLGAMQYSTAELRRQAVVDALAGPEMLHQALPTKQGEVRRLRARFADAQVRPAPAAAALATERSRPSRPLLLLGAVRGAVRQLRPSTQPGGPDAGPNELVLGHDQAYWWRLFRADSAVVRTADGSGVVHYRRDRRTFAGLLRCSASAHRRLHRQWPGLAARYREALPRLVSAATWQQTFDSVGRDA